MVSTYSNLLMVWSQCYQTGKVLNRTLTLIRMAKDENNLVVFVG